MEVKGSNQSLVKTTNQLLIVREVREHGRLSRSELAKRLSLSNPSVSKNVDDLINKGLLVETGSAVTDVGRRPIMLEFNGRHGCVAVIDLSSDDGRICIADLLGNKLEYSRVTGGKIITRENLSGIIYTMRAMLKNAADRCGPLVGICIGAPGVIEPGTGNIHWSARLEDFRELNLCEMFRNEFHVPVIVKNDVNLAVCGEKEFGCGKGCESMLYLSIDAGVGIGIVLGGKLYEGRRGFAGDLGVLMCDASKVADSPSGGCTSYMDMMLENELSTYALVSDIRKVFDSERDTVLRTFITSSDEITFADVVKAYGMGDSAVIEILNRYAKFMAVLMKNLASLFDVDMIVLGGQITKLGSSFTNKITEEFLSFPGYSTTDIRTTKLLDTAVIFGGIDTATQYAIEQIVEEKL